MINDLHTKEVSREELVKTFEILLRKELITQSEFQKAILIANEKYNPIK